MLRSIFFSLISSAEPEPNTESDKREAADTAYDASYDWTYDTLLVWTGKGGSGRRRGGGARV